MECPMMPKCIFFNDQMGDMPSVAENFKVNYCRDNYETCARYKVKQATGKSHPTLWPNESDKVEKAIEEMNNQPA